LSYEGNCTQIIPQCKLSGN